MLMTVMTLVLLVSIIMFHIVRYWAVLGVAVRYAVRALRDGIGLHFLWVRAILVAVVRSQPLIDYKGFIVMMNKVKGCSRAKLGSNWNNSSKCGSRYSKWNNSPLNLNSNKSSRSCTATVDHKNILLVAELNGLLADSFTLLRFSKEMTAKYTATAPLGLVGKPKILVGDLL
jgi:hypothetical protein